jgi:hypothetical protein
VHVELIVVPDARTLPWENGPDAQQKRHPARLEDTALRIPKRPPLALEHESTRDVMVARNQVPALDLTHVIERGLANDGATGDQLVGRRRAPQRRRQYPGRA